MNDIELLNLVNLKMKKLADKNVLKIKNHADGSLEFCIILNESINDSIKFTERRLTTQAAVCAKMINEFLDSRFSFLEEGVKIK
jgi:hypothetical protein